MKKGLFLYLLGFFCGVLAVRFYDYHITKTVSSFKTDPLLLVPQNKLIRRFGYVDESDDDALNLNSEVKLLKETVYENRSFSASTYSIKLDSFNTLLISDFYIPYQSNSFFAGGYNWSLVISPTKEEKKEYLYLLLRIDKSIFENNPGAKIYAHVKFYLHNKKDNNYFTFYDPKPLLFTKSTRSIGFEALPLLEYRNVENGFLYNGDHCEFGVDVIVPNYVNAWEHVTFIDEFRNPISTWYVLDFSKLPNGIYSSNKFSVGGREWTMRLDPNCYEPEQDNYFISLGLGLSPEETGRSNEELYAKFYLRIVDQINSNHKEVLMEGWYYYPGDTYTEDKLLALEELKDPVRGFLVDDTLVLEVQFIQVSSTKYSS